MTFSFITDNAFKRLIVCFLLAFLTFFAFSLILDNDFILYDDPGYVTENPHVLQGLTPESMSWAFQTTLTGNWIPLTWLTHMLDIELYDINPKGHHLNSLVLHMCNVILVFILFRMTTKKLWASALTAALFAIHPLRVESVAWISERKDVLSGFFGLLACITYVLYTADLSLCKRMFFYGLTFVLLVLGLMSKVMLVTWPFVFLLLDIWPLERFKTARLSSQKPGFRSKIGLILEKIPFYILSIIFCFIAFYAQKTQGAVTRIEQASVVLRFGNSLISYVRYLGKFFIPTKLALLYPIDISIITFTNVLLATFILSVISVVCLLLIKRKPYLFFGWFWFLGILIPVIGIVHIGSQAIADRYTYLPSIGISLIAAFGICDFASKEKTSQRMAVFMVFCIISALLILTWIQCAYWKNSLTIFARTIHVTSNNYVMQMNYSGTLESLGELDDAFREYQKASLMRPTSAEPFLKRGIICLKQKRYQQAIHLFEEALLKKEDIIISEVYNNLGIAYSKLEDYPRAISYFEKAIDDNPGCEETLKNLALTLLKDQKHQDAQNTAEKGLSLAISNENTKMIEWFSEFLRDLKTKP